MLRLSSKSHWDVPINIPLDAEASVTKRVHMLLHHPTPPAFDGAEGRNHLRNHDEIRLFADYVGCQQRPAPSIPSINPMRRFANSSSSRRTTTGPNSGAWGLFKEGHVLGVVCGAVLSTWQWLQGQLGGDMLQQQKQRQFAEAAAYLYDDAGQHGGLAPGMRPKPERPCIPDLQHQCDCKGATVLLGVLVPHLWGSGCMLGHLCRECVGRS